MSNSNNRTSTGAQDVIDLTNSPNRSPSATSSNHNTGVNDIPNERPRLLDGTHGSPDVAAASSSSNNASSSNSYAPVISGSVSSAPPGNTGAVVSQQLAERMLGELEGIGGVDKGEVIQALLAKLAGTDDPSSNNAGVPAVASASSATRNSPLVTNRRPVTSASSTNNHTNTVNYQLIVDGLLAELDNAKGVDLQVFTQAFHANLAGTNDTTNSNAGVNCNRLSPGMSHATVSLADRNAAAFVPVQPTVAGVPFASSANNNAAGLPSVASLSSANNVPPPGLPGVPVPVRPAVAGVPLSSSANNNAGGLPGVASLSSSNNVVPPRPNQVATRPTMVALNNAASGSRAVITPAPGSRHGASSPTDWVAKFNNADPAQKQKIKSYMAPRDPNPGDHLTAQYNMNDFRRFMINDLHKSENNTDRICTELSKLANGNGYRNTAWDFAFLGGQRIDTLDYNFPAIIGMAKLAQTELRDSKKGWLAHSLGYLARYKEYHHMRHESPQKFQSITDWNTFLGNRYT